MTGEISNQHDVRKAAGKAAFHCASRFPTPWPSACTVTLCMRHFRCARYGLCGHDRRNKPSKLFTMPGLVAAGVLPITVPSALLVGWRQWTDNVSR